MGQDSYLPLKKSGQSVIHRNLPYRFVRGQPLNRLNFTNNYITPLVNRWQDTLLGHNL